MNIIMIYGLIELKKKNLSTRKCKKIKWEYGGTKRYASYYLLFKDILTFI